MAASFGKTHHMTERRTAASTAGAAISVTGRVLARALRVFLGVFGAMEGRGNAVAPPPMPTPRPEKYRP